jgi:hypothetical protein
MTTKTKRKEWLNEKRCPVHGTRLVSAGTERATGRMLWGCDRRDCDVMAYSMSQLDNLRLLPGWDYLVE